VVAVTASAATSAAIGQVYGVCGNNDGSIFITLLYYSVRRVDLATGKITIYAGRNYQGTSGDGGKATSALLERPQVCTVDTAGNMYVASNTERTIRVVSASTTVITRYAGTGSSTVGSTGVDGPATSAKIVASSVFMNTVANLFIAEMDGNRVHKVTPNGMISVIAGTGRSTFGGNLGRATSASFSGTLMRVTSDALDNIYITSESRVIRVDGDTTVLVQVAGIISSVLLFFNQISFCSFLCRFDTWNLWLFLVHYSCTGHSCNI
jgi:serine/threonine-protein kinase